MSLKRTAAPPLSSCYVRQRESEANADNADQTGGTVDLADAARDAEGSRARAVERAWSGPG
jgi:hypothetical protein